MRCLYAGLILASLAVHGQTPATSARPKSTSKPFTPPKTPWGDPDLQGLWPGSLNIPLQRPASFGTRNELTDKELAERDAQEKTRVENGHWIEYYASTRQASLIIDPKDGRLPPMTPEAAKRNRALRDGLGPPSLGGVSRGPTHGWISTCGAAALPKG